MKLKKKQKTNLIIVILIAFALIFASNSFLSIFQADTLPIKAVNYGQPPLCTGGSTEWENNGYCFYSELISEDSTSITYKMVIPISEWLIRDDFACRYFGEKIGFNYWERGKGRNPFRAPLLNGNYNSLIQNTPIQSTNVIMPQYSVTNNLKTDLFQEISENVLQNQTAECYISDGGMYCEWFADVKNEIKATANCDAELTFGENLETIVTFPKDLPPQTYYRLENEECSPIEIKPTETTLTDYETETECEKNIPRDSYYRYLEDSNECQEVKLKSSDVTGFDYPSVEDCNENIKSNVLEIILISVFVLLVIFSFVFRRKK